jgi:hypothetical protein
MHFTYDQQLKRTELMQGDVLERTPAINALLKDVHPHFYQHPKNLFFMVLTQSCDLVTRPPGGRCKAPYIAIAPVRTLDLVVERHIAQTTAADVKSPLPVVSEKIKTKTSEFLMRLLNNNEPGYFFLYGGDTSLGSDCVTFLNLSIAIKSELHLSSCLEAKILQLASEFQAKLGWLLGQLFSRVGTQDWEPKELTRKISGLLKDAAIWVPDATISHLEAEFARRREQDTNAAMTVPEISRAVSSAPTKKQAVLDQALKVISDLLGSDRQGEIALLRKRLESDSSLTSLLK